MTARRAFLFVFAAALLVNATAYLHAWRFTHFAESGSRTAQPEQLGVVARAWVVLTGVRVPRPTVTRTPQDLGLHARTVNVGTTSVWAVDGAGAGTVALFHGYGGTKSDLLDEAAVFHAAGYSTLLVDFPGGGDSPGRTTTLGWDEAETVRDVVASTNAEPLVLFGKSMGSAAILRAVSTLNVRADCLVLESPFDRLVTTVGHRFEAMGLPSWPGASLLVIWGGAQSGFNGLNHNPVEYATTVSTPTLLLHGAADPRVHTSEVAAIARALAGPHRLVHFPDAGHEELVRADSALWESSVFSWLERECGGATHRRAR